MLERIINSIKQNSRVLLAVGTMLASGCATTNPPDNYFVKCYKQTPEKLWTGLTSPFMAVAGIFCYDYICPGSHEHGFGCEVLPDMLTGIIGFVPLIGEGAYNLIAVPLPLPSAAPLMNKTVHNLQNNLSSQSGWRSRDDGFLTMPSRNRWFMNFYEQYQSGNR